MQNSDIKPKLKPIELFDLGNDFNLAVCPENGAWLGLNDDVLDIVKTFDGKSSTAELIEKWSNLYTISELSELINLLAAHKLIEPEKPVRNFSCTETPDRAPRLAVLNMTQQCNLSCKYCYVDADITKSNFMTFETAIRIIDEMLLINHARNEKTTILFHGGEPFLNFEVMRRVAEYYAGIDEKDINFELQTNATLLTPEHIEFIKKCNVNVGISLDGAKDIHDKNRVTQNGYGSFDMVMKGIELLKQNNINFGVIVVLTKQNCRQVDDIFDLLVKLGIRSFSINPVFYGGRCSENIDEIAVTGDELFAAYKTLVDKIITYNTDKPSSKEKVQERILKYITRNIITAEPSFMCMRTPCGAGIDTVAFDVNGDVYICDDFIHQSEYNIGNVYHQKLSEILKHDTVSNFTQCTINQDENCSVCTWRKFCNGICPSHRLYFRKTGRNNVECEFRRKLIPYLMKLFVENEGYQFLLDRDINRVESRTLYFNINYSCNNACIFCVSDRTVKQGINSSDMSLESFEASLKLHSAGENDTVIINGGEPTVSAHLIPLLHSVKKSGAHSCLFTNGRKLSNKAFCEEVIKTGVNRITIPIYADNAKAFEYLTNVPGSFEQTLSGIDNIISLRDILKSNVEVVLKLLFFKPTLKTNPDIFSWIMKRFPGTDFISLNSLIISDAILERYSELVPDADEISYSLNATLDRARFEKSESKVQLWDVPFCLVEDRNSIFLPGVKHKNNSVADFYFDDNCLSGHKRYEKVYLPDMCLDCIYTGQCSFAKRVSDGNDSSIRSLNAMFPDAVLVHS
jgi:radical SAM protein with 4Fe4S-binding SPASM domain